MLSAKLIRAVRNHPGPQYRLAHRIGVAPGTLSAWLCGIYVPRHDDDRVRQLGALVGVAPNELFDRTDDAHVPALGAANAR